MEPVRVTLVNGKARIDDLTEDAPLVTFHGTAAQTQLMADVFERGLKAMEKENSNG